MGPVADRFAEHSDPARVLQNASEAPGNTGSSNFSPLLDNPGSAGEGRAGGSLADAVSARANGYSLEQKVIGPGRRTDHDRGVSSAPVDAVDGQDRGGAEGR